MKKTVLLQKTRFEKYNLRHFNKNFELNVSTTKYQLVLPLKTEKRQSTNGFLINFRKLTTRPENLLL